MISKGMTLFAKGYFFSLTHFCSDILQYL